VISRASLVAGGVVGLIMGLPLFHLVNIAFLRPAAVSEGRELERTAALKKAIELIQQRSQTNAKIRDLDPAGLCGALGGRWMHENCE
jgi:hypothetical protein